MRQWMWFVAATTAVVAYLGTMASNDSDNRRCPYGYSFNSKGECTWLRKKAIHSFERARQVCMVYGGRVSSSFQLGASLSCVVDSIPKDQLHDRAVQSNHPYLPLEEFNEVVGFPGGSCYKVWFDNRSHTQSAKDTVRLVAEHWTAAPDGGTAKVLIPPVKHSSLFTEGTGAHFDNAYIVKGNAVVAFFNATEGQNDFGFIAYVAHCD